jgi:hypothetical protein
MPEQQLTLFVIQTMPGTDILRVNYKPTRITAGASQLQLRETTSREAGYTIRSVTGGDYVLQIRRQGARDVTVEGS